MKKVLASILVALTAIFMISTNDFVKAEEDLIDLYPNGNIANLQGQYGNSNWVLEFNGRRYHTVSFMARFASRFTGIEDLEKEVFTASDVPGVSANAMGGLFINNTERDVVMSAGDRTGLTGVINRAWAYFDENGRLYMFEDHVSAYYLTKVEDEDYWRLSTEDEIAAFEALEEPAEGEEPVDLGFEINHGHIRIMLDEDGNGYKAEPLAYLSWYNKDYVAANAEEEIEESGSKSVLFDPEVRDPRSVVLPKGHTIYHISTWDRGVSEMYTDWAMKFPEVIADVETELRSETKYIDPAPTFFGITALDVNDQVAGVNIVVEYGVTVEVADFIAGVSAQHKNEAQSQTATDHTKVPFKLEVLQNGEVIETVNVAADGTPDKAEFEMIDSGNFGAGYELRYSAVSPDTETQVQEVVATVDVGVLPININNVRNREIDENTSVDLYDGITADDNYGNDISASITIDDVAGLNIYNAKAGVYNVTVRASYVYGEQVDDSQPLTVSYGELTHTFPAENINPTANIGIGTDTAMRRGVLITNEAAFDKAIADLTVNSDMAAVWSGTFFGLYDGGNNLIAYFNQGTGKQLLNGVTSDIDAPTAKATRDAYLNQLVWDNNYKFVAITNSPAPSAFVLFSVVPVEETIEGFPESFLVEAERTYQLRVVDKQDPQIHLHNKTFVIYTDHSYANALEAILSNVTVIDENLNNVVSPGANRLDITIPGEHEVTVTATDLEGNMATVDFTLVVKEARASQDEVDALLDEIEALEAELEAAQGDTTALEAEIEALEAELSELETDLGAKIDDHPTGTSMVVTIIIAVVAAGLSFGGAVLFLGKKS